MLDFIISVITGSAVTAAGVSYIFGFLDELTKLDCSIDIDFIKSCKEDSRELRFIPRLIILCIIYLVQFSHNSGVWSIKILRKSFRFLFMKSK